MRSRRILHVLAGALVLAGGGLLAAPAGAAATHGAGARTGDVVDGNARFEVLTPTLIRLEYAADGAFEDRPTQTAVNRDLPVPSYTVSDSLGTTTIDTGALQLHYVDSSGPFTPANLSIDLTVAGTATTARPAWNACQESPSASCDTGGGLPTTTQTDPTAIGGWTHEVGAVNPGDEVASDTGAPTSGTTQDTSPVLFTGFLHTTGWYLLDDTDTAVLTSPTTAVPRPTHTGPYQDGYFFGYGHDYATAFDDLKELTGPAPLLPEWTFGPWFSRYYPYTAADYENTLIPAFRAHDTPVDGLSVDTDFKAPDHWNGWSFNSTSFPDPSAFLAWAKSQGLHVVLNIHPSIDSTDPHFAQAQATAGGTLQTSDGDCQFYRSDPPCYVFDWGQPAQAKAYFDLHEPFYADGASAFWLDWCCDASTVSTPGLTPDDWVDQLYAQFALAHGQRPFVLARIGSAVADDNGYTGDVVAPTTGPWSAHRSAIAFTGDGISDWQTLAFEAVLTAGEGEAIGEPYLSNDIGGYSGDHLADDLYVRWVQLGTFSPIDRLHSDHGDRLPWDYDAAAEAPAEEFLRLREALVPYLYDAAEQAHVTGFPLARGLALSAPDDATAVATTDEWMLGDSLLVAPITSSGATATRSVYFPAGQWTNFFTGATVQGPTTQSVTAGFDQMPVYVKAGGIVPLAPPMSHVGAAPESPLTLRVAPGGDGTSSYFQDAGDGLNTASATTPLTATDDKSGARSLTIGPIAGSYDGAPRTRAYDVQFLASDAPSGVTVGGAAVPRVGATSPVDLATTDGATPTSDSWSYDATTRTVSVHVAARPVDAPLTVAYAPTVGADLPESPHAALLVLAALVAIGTAVAVRRRIRSSPTPTRSCRAACSSHPTSRG